jgi:hypothetical protein
MTETLTMSKNERQRLQFECVVNHGGVHSRCKERLKKLDIRIALYEFFSLIAEPSQILCHHCLKD